MLTNGERDQLRALEKHLVREAPELAAKFDHPALAEQRFPRWLFLLVIVGSLAGTMMIVIGAVNGWALVAWVGTLLAIGVPIASFQWSR